MFGQSKWQANEASQKAAYKDFKRWQKIVAAKYGWSDGDFRLDASRINSERANQVMTIDIFQISMHIVKVPYRLGSVETSDWGKDSVHYQVKIWIGQDVKKGFVFTYSQGSGIKQWPTI